MANIDLNIDTGGVTNVPDDSGVIDVVIPIDIKTICNDCNINAFNPEIVCTTDEFFNCNTCGNDMRSYGRPWIEGDCIYFQLQNQDTLNGPNAISFAQWNARATPRIKYGWYHTTLNPTNWTIKAEAYNACNDEKVPQADFESLYQQACVSLYQDMNASYKGYPAQAWYRWCQNLNICMNNLPVNWPDEFYIKFIVKSHSNTNLVYYSQPFKKLTCGNSIQLEGAYTSPDCMGFNYSDPTQATGLKADIKKPPYNLDSNCLFTGRPGNYRNLIRLEGECWYSGETITRETPYRQQASTVVRKFSLYRVILKPVPPYIAKEIARDLEGKYAYIGGVTLESQPVRIQLPGTLTKNWEQGRYWYPDFEVQTFECVQDMNCTN